ncbi:TPA: hypothetical protein ACX3DU_004172 [Vibrio parahaemolyticus]|uniref:hypothetical protein n=1 Tax=Vibrio vulnificus TaxID=672 RepID=UPI002FD15415|nr:hypothetical protein [Vibrio metschnikovii]
MSKQVDSFVVWAEKERISEASPEYSYAMDAYDLALEHAKLAVSSAVGVEETQSQMALLINEELDALKQG